jgi:hypothetical protein
MRKFKGFILLVAAVSAIAILFSGCNPDFTLTAIANPIAGGNITPSGGSYSKGVPVNVTATANSGYRFDHWEGGASGNSPTALINMDNAKNLTAYFAKTYSLSATPSPSTGGNVSPSSGNFDAGKQIILIATVAQYYKFNGWAGDASGSSDHLTVTMDSNKSISASFVRMTVNLQTQADASGGGSVSPNSGTFDAGTQKTITANPATGYRFDHWGGDASGTVNPLNVLMDSNKNISAFFIKVNKLSVSESPVGSGTYTISPSASSYDAGTRVILTAATTTFPNAFDHWTSTDNDNANPTVVTMNSDKVVTAAFKTLVLGILVTKKASLPAGGTIATIALNSGQWVQGHISGDLSIGVRIVDASNNPVNDLGWTQDSQFTFQAKTSGPYGIMIYGTNTALYDNRYTYNYTLTYTPYQ